MRIFFDRSSKEHFLRVSSRNENATKPNEAFGGGRIPGRKGGRGRAGRRKSDAERVGAKKKMRRIAVACPAVPFAASVSNAN